MGKILAHAALLRENFITGVVTVVAAGSNLNSL